MTTDPALLEILDLELSYGDVRVLETVSLSVNEGEIVALIGPNAAGKTSLLKTVMGLIRPSKGTVNYKGRPIQGRSPEDLVAQGISLVPEGARVFQEMSVLDNLKMGSYCSRARANRNRNLDSVFAVFPRLAERLRQKAGTLSGGERQMLAVGRALMSEPTLLLLDEPSLGLQPLMVKRVFETIAGIAADGLTVLLVEQNVRMSLRIAHRAYVLERGRITLHGAPSSLLDSEHVRKAYLSV